MFPGNRRTCMKIRLLCLIALAGIATLAQAATKPEISAARILARTRVLASDEFEGRAPATPAEDRTVAYLVDEFKKMGLAPGNPDGTYVQAVPMFGITSTTSARITVGGRVIDLVPIRDFVGPSPRIVPHLEVKDSDVVFVGYGVTAPEFNWDDFKGVDVRGKTLVMLINDPPVPDPTDAAKLDPKVFGGAAMTYYGRWTYKYESAAAHGAAACLIVHETGPAAYPFSVVVDSRNRENFELVAPDGGAGRAAIEGWLTLDAAQALFAAAGQDFAKLKEAAARRDFRPVPFAAKAGFTVDNTIRRASSRNVVALLPGSDLKSRDEYVVYSAHWDHLGRDPRLSGDQIFNGALDNASGVAVLLELAQAFAALPADGRARRSVVFLSTTAEEKGLLGARYYVQHPLHPLARTLADINMDVMNPLGRTADIEVCGFGGSTIDDVAAVVAREQGRVTVPDSQPEKGSFYRADHFEFAQAGVPAYYPKSGKRYLGQPDDFGQKFSDEYTAKRYHKPTDEVQPDWTMEGAAQDTEFLFQVGLEIANGDHWPQWRDGSEFKAARDAMLKASR
jgi:Zn-dependent M28 family amino/carboxypeptidase